MLCREKPCGKSSPSVPSLRGSTETSIAAKQLWSRFKAGRGLCSPAAFCSPAQHCRALMRNLLCNAKKLLQNADLGWFSSSQGEEPAHRIPHQCSHHRARDGQAAERRTMPFTEATLSGLAARFFPFSWYWGCGIPLWVPAVSGPISSPHFWGDPQDAAVPYSPPAMHWDPQQAAPGPILLNSALSNSLGLSYWKLLQFPACLEKMTAANPN